MFTKKKKKNNLDDDTYILQYVCIYVRKLYLHLELYILAKFLCQNLSQSNLKRTQLFVTGLRLTKSVVKTGTPKDSEL